MGHWHGMIKMGTYELDVTILYEKPPDRYEIKWNGSGIYKNLFPYKKDDKVDTNYGKIQITEIINDKSSNHIVHFIGLENPTGKLGYDINKTLEETVKWYKEYYENKNVITDYQINKYVEDLQK